MPRVLGPVTQVVGYVKCEPSVVHDNQLFLDHLGQVHGLTQCIRAQYSQFYPYFSLEFVNKRPHCNLFGDILLRCLEFDEPKAIFIEPSYFRAKHFS